MTKSVRSSTAPAPGRRRRGSRLATPDPRAAPDPQALRKSPLYSEELGIDLAAGTDEELFKWFLASALFGARISESIARNTYRAFERHGLLDPESILEAGWDVLVGTAMAEGGYVRYDNQRSTQILRNCRTLIDEYGGSFRRLHDEAADSSDLEHRIERFYGVGPVTANIFLRELRPYWKKADPDPLPVVVELARRIGIDLEKLDRQSVEFCRVEAGVIRDKRTISGTGRRRDAE